MMPRTMCVVALLVMCSSMVHAELTPEQSARAQALIAQFSAREFGVRQKAVEDLVAMGTEVLPLVKQTLARADDNEVKLRCQMVIDGLADAVREAQRLVEKPARDLGPAPPRGAQWIRYSDDATGVAYVIQRDDKQVLVHNGVEGPAEEGISRLELSRDGKHYLYYTRRDRKPCVLHDGKAFPLGDSEFVAQSPDGTRLVFHGIARDGQFFHCDDNPPQKFEAILETAFSSDSKHLVFTTKRDGKWIVMIDGIEGPSHDRIWLPRKPAVPRYIVEDAGELWAIETEWPAPDGPAPRKLGERRLLHLGSVLPGRSVTHSGGWNVTFGECGGLSDMAVLLSDGKTRAPGTVRYSADGRHFVRFADRDGSKTLVWKNVESEPYDGLGQFAVSRDERRIAWVGVLMKHETLVCDSRPVYKFGPMDEHNNVGRMRFSPDGKRFAWVRRRDSKDVVVCDDQEGREYDRVMPPRFSADSQHLWYAAQDSAGWCIVCDDREGPPHEKIRVPQDTDDGADVLRYIVQDGQKLKAVEVDWPTEHD